MKEGYGGKKTHSSKNSSQTFPTQQFDERTSVGGGKQGVEVNLLKNTGATCSSISDI